MRLAARPLMNVSPEHISRVCVITRVRCQSSNQDHSGIRLFARVYLCDGGNAVGVAGAEVEGEALAGPEVKDGDEVLGGGLLESDLCNMAKGSVRQIPLQEIKFAINFMFKTFSSATGL